MVHPLEYMWQPDNYVTGIGHPVVIWDGKFWGSHGQTSYGASARLRVYEMNFTPNDNNKMTRFRMLGPNKAQESESDEEIEVEYNV